MSRFWPHAIFAEDQPFAHGILVVHVLTRGAQAGSLIGAGVGSSMFLLRKYQFLKPSTNTFATTVLRSTGVGTLVGLGVLTVGLEGRMWGRDKVEWEDRSWRLLANEGQVECDDWMYTGMLIGAVDAVRSGSSTGRKSLLGGIGKVGIGGTVGLIGYMGWRYAINGGKRDERDIAAI